MFQPPENIRTPVIPMFMDVTQRPVRCRLDGAIVDVRIHSGQASIDEGPFPVYEFACLLCDQEDEIS